MPKPSNLRPRQQIAIEYLATSALVPDPRNARVHSTKQIARLGAAIDRLGFLNAILIDDELRVVAGHGRGCNAT